MSHPDQTLMDLASYIFKRYPSAYGNSEKRNQLPTDEEKEFGQKVDRLQRLGNPDWDTVRKVFTYAYLRLRGEAEVLAEACSTMENTFELLQDENATLQNILKSRSSNTVDENADTGRKWSSKALCASVGAATLFSIAGTAAYFLNTQEK